MSKNKFKKALLSLGITLNLLNSVPKQAYEILYLRLRIPMKLQNPPLKVTTSWQLLLLTGQVDILSQLGNASLSSLRDNWNANISHYAARFGNTQQLNGALALSQTPDSFTLLNEEDRNDTERIINTLREALSSNFTLLTVNILCEISQAAKDEIYLKLARNRVISETLLGLKQIIIGYYQKGSIFFELPRELLLIVFQKTLPANIPEQVVKRVLNTLMENLAPINFNSNSLFFRLSQDPTDKITSLTSLKEGFNVPYSSLEQLQQKFGGNGSLIITFTASQGG
jgi:hypothetical protein